MPSLSRSQSNLMPDSTWRRAIHGLGPYQSLALLLVPLGIVEPPKLAAVAIAGKRHWVSGSGMIVAAYAVSILLVERLFEIVKPKLLMLDWLARLWTRFVAFRRRVVSWFASWTTISEPKPD